MKKITTLAKIAFNENKNFKGSNTEVRTDNEWTKLLLFGNCIARKNKYSGMFEISNAGWFSNTTKERLNVFDGVSINQKNFRWFLNGIEWTGEWTTIN